MDTVQRPFMSLRSTVPDGSKRSCPHASGEAQRGDDKPVLSEENCGSTKWIVCALTWLGGWNGGCDALKDGAGLCWTWRSSAIRGRQRRAGAGRALLPAASHAAALNGDGFGHVHAQRGA